MIDISRSKWDLSSYEQYAINWFNENGFDGTLDKQFISKTIFTIMRDGVTDKFELPQNVKGMDMKHYMEQFRRIWDMLRELVKLRQEVQFSSQQ